MRPFWRPIAHPLCGALCGLSFWTSAGVLAFAGSSAASPVIGLLPSAAWLLCAVVTGAGLALALRRCGVAAATFLLPVISMLAWTTMLSSPAVVAWAGPAAVIPLALLGTGVLWQLSPALPPARWSPLAATLLAAAAFSAIIVTRPLPITGDEPHYLLATQSLLEDGDLDLTDDYDARTYRSYYSGVLEPRHVAIGTFGQQYSFHGIGVSVLVLPGFFVAGPLGARLTIALISALGIGFFWSAAYRLSASASAAWVTTLALTSAAPLTFHAISIYPDGVAAAITSIALWVLVTLVCDGAIGVSAAVGVGSALATLPWLHLRLSSTAGVFGLALLLAMWRRRDLMLPFLAAPAISLTGWIASTWVMFGTTDPTAIFRRQATGSLAAMPTGMLGLLFDVEYGLLIYTPVMAVAVLGLIVTLRRSALVGLTAAVLTTTAVAIGGAWVWWGGDSAPARFLAPILPLLCIMLAVWWTRASHATRAFSLCLLLTGACLTTMMIVAEGGRFIVNAPDGQGSIFEWLSPNVDLALALPALFRAGADVYSEAPVALAWTLIGMGLFAATAGVQRWRALTAGTAWVLASFAFLAWLTLGATAGWWWRGTPPWTPDRGQLRLLQAAASPALRVGLIGPQPLIGRPEQALSRMRIALPLLGTTTALHVPFVPAGRYAIDTDGLVADPEPTMTLELGRGALPFAIWRGRMAGGFSLAVPIYLVRVTSDMDLSRHERAVRLRPLSVAAPAISDIAIRATRYDTLVVYALDGYSYPERDGFWMAADRSGRVLVADLDGRAASATMTFEAAGAAATLTLTSGAFSRVVTLAPHANKSIAFPATETLAPLQISVTGGTTRPAGDGRQLGVFVRVAPSR